MNDRELKSESGVVGSVIMNPERIGTAITAGVDAGWFSDAKCALLWDAAVSIFRRDGERGIDGNRVYDEALRLAAQKGRHEGTILTLDDLMGVCDVPGGAYLEFYIRDLQSKVMVRRINAAGDWWRKNLREGIPPEAIWPAYMKRLAEAVTAGIASRAADPREEAAKLLREYEEAHRIRIVEKNLDYVPGYSFPWPVMNKLLNGLQPSTLMYVGARPSVGKTMVTLNFIRHWCECGLKVGFVSLDMGIHHLMKRPLAELARVSFNKASFGTTSNADLAALKEAVESVGKWPLKIIAERDVDHVCAWAKAMHASGELDILVVDFVQLMQSKAVRFGNSEERLEYVSGQFKEFTNGTGVPVVALSQLNRECEKDGGRVPTASDLRGSGALEQDATIIALLHIDTDTRARWHQPTPGYPNGRFPAALTVNNNAAEGRSFKPIRFIVGKNQNGSAGPDVWLPLVAIPAYGAVHLGDAWAQPDVETVGYGATAKGKAYYYARFERICADRRKSDIERAWAAHGVLISEEEQRRKMGL